MRILHPLTPDVWVTRQLRANAALMALVQERVFDEESVDLAPYSGKQGQNDGWPYLVYRIEDEGVDLVHEKRPMMATSVAVVRAVMRRDKVPKGVTLKSYLSPATEDAGIVGAIIRTLMGVRDPEAVVGRVWSSRYLGVYRNAYLEENVDHLELGGRFRIQNTGK